MLSLLILACAREPDHTRYARALHETEPIAAWDTCLTIADPTTRGDCQASVAAHTGWFVRCGQIEVTKWRDECWFEAAEQESRDGDMVGALGACSRSGFAMQCQDHVLGMIAMTWLTLPIAEVSDRFAALHVTTTPPAPGATGPRPAPGASLGFLFWRHSFRNRLARGLPVSREGCRDRDCRGAAETEVAASLSMAVAANPAICAAEPTLPWDRDADGHRMMQRAWGNACSPKPVGRYRE